jgi:hypothetical protein
MTWLIVLAAIILLFGKCHNGKKDFPATVNALNTVLVVFEQIQNVLQKQGKPNV